MTDIKGRRETLHTGWRARQEEEEEEEEKEEEGEEEEEESAGAPEATRCAKFSPGSVRIGTPLHSTSPDTFPPTSARVHTHQAGGVSCTRQRMRMRHCHTNATDCALETCERTHIHTRRRARAYSYTDTYKHKHRLIDTREHHPLSYAH